MMLFSILYRSAILGRMCSENNLLPLFAKGLAKKSCFFFLCVLLLSRNYQSTGFFVTLFLFVQYILDTYIPMYTVAHKRSLYNSLPTEFAAIVSFFI